MDNESKIRVL